MTLRILFAVSVGVALCVAPVMFYGFVRWFLVTYSDAPDTGATIATLCVVAIAEACYVFGAAVWLNAWIHERKR